MELHVVHGIQEAGTQSPAKLEEVLQKANHSRQKQNLGSSI
jgi:hypothetical protein